MKTHPILSAALTLSAAAAIAGDVKWTTKRLTDESVSYTHLTLPTICSV